MGGTTESPSPRSRERTGRKADASNV